MEIKILCEAGYEEALLGMSLSYYDEQQDFCRWWETQYEKAQKRAVKLAVKNGGHNKFLESISVWVLVKAPLSFWKQADTYRMSTKQSTSTMHTLRKRRLRTSDFTAETSPISIGNLQSLIDSDADVDTLRDNVPNGFLERRLWLLSYKTIKNIIEQRSGHRSRYWDEFIQKVLAQLEFPELVSPKVDRQLIDN